MKKTLKKIKAIITALGIAIGSFCFKVMAQLEGIKTNGPTAGIAPYDPYDIEIPQGISSPWGIIAIKISKRALLGITLITGIISVIKIKKTDDKSQKKKRVKTTIVIMGILVLILAAAFLIPTLLLKK